MGKRYSDDFRSSAVLMLEAAGYPDTKGALMVVANRLDVPHATLSRWSRGIQNPPPPEMVHEKKVDFIVELKDLLGISISAAKDTASKASYRELVTGVGIIVDKLQLLTGQPTWRGEIIDLLRSGAVAPEVVEAELGDELARELFNAAGVSRA